MTEQTSIDQLDRFLFEAIPIRGERVLIKELWREVQLRRDYPDAVKVLLGELIATTALLNATIKVDEGKLTVQLEAAGAVNLLVVQINQTQGIRAVARHGEIGNLATLKALCGEGRIIITIDSPKFKEPYQGVIPLVDETITAAIERYFKTSEQLETKLFLKANNEVLSGFLLQRLPGEMVDADNFNRVCQMAHTLSDDECFNLDTKTLLYRLYSDDDIRLFEPEQLHFECSCSRERSLGMLVQFKPQELFEMLAEESGNITVNCEFCGVSYTFNEADLEAILK